MRPPDLLPGMTGPLAAAAGQVGHALRMTADLLEPSGQRRRRRVWTTAGRATLEVRGLHPASPASFRGDVHRAVSEVRGVKWVEVNDILGRVLVAFDEDSVSVSDVLEVVGAVEERHGHAAKPFSLDAPDHPADAEPLLAAGLALAADCAGLGVAIGGRVLRWPALPRAAAAAVVVIDAQPRLRAQLEHRLGRQGTDLLLALATAGAQALSQGPGTLAVDACQRVEDLLESGARRSVWLSREAELHRVRDRNAAGGSKSAPRRTSAVIAPRPRPVPLPAGPVEHYTDRVALAALPAAGAVLALTRRPGRAADILLTATPRVARLGRESFAATLDAGLCRRGLVSMDSSAFRRLDRVSLVLLDSTVLTTSRQVVLQAQSRDSGYSDAEIWSACTALLPGQRSHHGQRASPGAAPAPYLRRIRSGGSPPDATLVELRVAERVLGTAVVGQELDPWAEAVVSAARAAGVRVLLTDSASARPLNPGVDEVIAGGRGLTASVRRQQSLGHVVLLVSRHRAALMAADVSIGVLTNEDTRAAVPWGADLLCGPGLRDAWRVLSALRPASAVSRRSATLAASGAALSGLLALAGRRGAATAATAPVHTAGLTAMGLGAWAALGILRLPDPERRPYIAWESLTPAEAFDRARELTEEPARTPAVAAVSRFRAVADAFGTELASPLTPVLGVGATASALLGGVTDAALVGSVAVGNALIGAVQRLRAEGALRDLLLEQAPAARRVRSDSADGTETETVPAAALRVGDVVELRAGDVVPADLRLLTEAGLEVDESSLTGESLPVRKTVLATPGADVADRTCLLYAGSSVLAGQAVAVVVAVGTATMAGRAVSGAHAPRPVAGVAAQLGALTRVSLPITLLGGAAVSALSLVRGRPLPEAVASGVAVAVAAVPEGLPLVATMAQLAAARRLGHHGAAVRASAGLEALGRVDTMCFDKTGTLTANALSLREVRPWPATSSGGEADPSAAEARALLLTAATRACPDSGGVPVSHATDRAVLAARAGTGTGWRRVRELAFESHRALSLTVGALDGQPGFEVSVKGAPEAVLARVDGLTAGAQARAQAEVARLAEQGLRVLAVARTQVANLPTDLDDIGDLHLLGWIGLADTARPGAAQAVAQLVASGLRIVVVTGDHPVTAVGIARELDIPLPDRVLTGNQLATMSEEERVVAVARTTVFARITPAQKVSIVEALRRGGAVIAMTGDGTNDAAALRLADVGIALEGSGTAAARRAAALVLSRPDLSILTDAVAEGRALWRNVEEAVGILVGGNAGEVAYTMVGTAIAGRAPIGTRQLLLVNLLTDMFPALAIAVAHRGAPPLLPGGPLNGHPAADLLTAGPHRGMGGRLFEQIAVRGTATALGATLAWGIGRASGPRRRASSMGLAALVGAQLGQTAVMGLHRPLVLATAVVSAGALVAVVQTPGLSQFFGCTPLDPLAWMVVLGAAGTATGSSVLLPRALPLLRRTLPGLYRREGPLPLLTHPLPRLALVEQHEN
ncbi:MAG: HAD-IC family P-type ATPase [Mycobacteriales bacterium]